MAQRADTGQVNGSAVASTVAFALSQGLSVDRIEAVTGRPIMALIVPQGRLPIAVRDALWTELSRLHSGRMVSLEMARSADLAVFDGLADAVRFAPDLRAALSLLVRNCLILGDHITFELDESSQKAAFFLSHASASDGEQIAGEAGAVMIMRMLWEAFGKRLPMTDLAFAFGATGPHDAYEGALGIKPTFERGRETMFVFDKDALDMKPFAADRQRFQSTELYFDLRRRLIGESTGPSPLARLTAAVARRVELGDYTAHGAAAEAHMSLRTAQRFAAFHGKTLKGMIDEARAAKAQSLIVDDPGTPIEDIAVRVGYSDERAFRRAFQRWMDMTPGAFKRLVKRSDRESISI